MQKKPVFLGKRTLFLFSLVFYLVGLEGCFEGKTAGNSAEIGNPEIASIEGIIRHSDGSLARKALVEVVPFDFEPATDSLPERWKTFTDSLGAYFIDSLPAKFSIEAHHDSSGTMMLSFGFTNTDTSYSATLEDPGALRFSAGNFSDGDTIEFSIRGSTILRKAVVRYGSIVFDSIPASLLSEVVINGEVHTLETPIEVNTGELLNIDSEQISLSLKFPLGNEGLTDTLKCFPLVLRLGKEDIDFNMFSKISGCWTATLGEDTLDLALPEFSFENEMATFWTEIPKFTGSAKDTLVLHFKEGECTQQETTLFRRNYIGVWHFEDSENPKDESTNALHGIAHNVVETNGVVGKAFLYNGLDSYVEIPGTSEGPLNFSAKDTMSISVWVRLDSINTSRFIYGKGATQYHLKYYYPAGWLFERYYETEEETKRVWYQPADTLRETRVWTMISVVQKDSLFELYVDGELVDNESATGTFESPVYTLNNFEIGREVFPVESDSTGQYFYGVIDELHIQDKAVSAGNIKASYLNQRPEDYWPKPLP